MFSQQNICSEFDLKDVCGEIISEEVSADFETTRFFLKGGRDDNSSTGNLIKEKHFISNRRRAGEKERFEDSCKY